MPDEPPSFNQRFNAFFTARKLMGIIGFLIGVLAMRLLGF